MPSLSSAIRISLRDSTTAVPSPSYGTPIVIGEDTDGQHFNEVKTYYSQSEVEKDFGADSPISKATAKAFAQGIGKILVVNVHDGNSPQYDSVLSDLAERAQYDIIIPTIDAGNSNAPKLVDHAGAYHKLLILPYIGSKDDAIAKFGAITPSDYVYAVAHDDATLTPAELAGAVGGLIATLKPWQTCEWVEVQNIDPAGYKDSEIDALEQNNIATIMEIVKPVLSNARVLSGGRVYISRSKVYLAEVIRTDLVNLKLRLNNMGQGLRYDKLGLDVLKSKIEETLRTQQKLGILKPDWTDNEGNLHRGFEVYIPAYEDIPDSDISAGILRNVRITAYLMNYIEKIELELVITL
jgi:hypothetical protein